MKNFLQFIGIVAVLDGIWTGFGGKILIRSQGWIHPSWKFSIISSIVGLILILISKIYFSSKKSIK